MKLVLNVIVTVLILTCALFLRATAQTDTAVIVKPSPKSKSSPPNSKPKPKPKPKTDNTASKQQQSKRRLPKPAAPAATVVAIISVSEPAAEISLYDGAGTSVFENETELSPADGSDVEIEGLKPGVYSLTVRKDGFISRQLSITVAKGKPNRWAIELKSAIAFLSVSLKNVTDAVIEIAGVGRFTGSVTRQAVAPGTYSVAISRKGYITSNRDVVIAGIGVEQNIVVTLEEFPVGEMLTQAEAAILAGDNDRAAILAGEVLNIDTDNREANRLLGMATFLKGESGAAFRLIKALRLGASLALDVQIFTDSGVKRFVAGRLLLDRDYLLLECVSERALSIRIFKPELKKIERKFDKQTTSFVSFEGKGDSNGKKTDRTVNIYSRHSLFRVAGKDRETFCRQVGKAAPQCESDTQNLFEVIRGWQTGLR